MSRFFWSGSGKYYLSSNTATTGPTGAATFSNLTLTGTAGSYTLSFGATGLTPASSGPIAPTGWGARYGRQRRQARYPAASAAAANSKGRT